MRRLGGTDVKHPDRRLAGEVLREFSIFFAVLFLTCIVGIIELLPEFDKIHGNVWLGGSLSAIYFGLLALMIFSIDKCFWLYEQNKRLTGEFGFNFPEIEPFYLKGKKIERLLIAGILVTFFILYLVKIGFLL